VLVLQPADQDRQADRKAEAQQVEQRRPVPPGRAELGRERHQELSCGLNDNGTESLTLPCKGEA
jgi:hypothetical protein